MTGYFEHPDSRGVYIEMWVVDLLDGDLASALLFSQLLWWHQPAKSGAPRLRFTRDDLRWLVRADDGWWDDCRLTVKQVRRVRSMLTEKGLIEYRRFKVAGAPTSAWRPSYDGLQALIRPNPELPSEGQFHGSDPQGAVGSDPQGAVPIPLETTDTPITGEEHLSAAPTGVGAQSLLGVPHPQEPTLDAHVHMVFDAWVASTQRTAATVLDAKRRKLIVAALKAYPLADVFDAARGWEHSAHHRGENDQRIVYNDLSLLLRDAGTIERFRDYARGPRQPTRLAKKSVLPANDRALAEDPSYWGDDGTETDG